MKAEKLVPAVAETPFPPPKRDLTFYLVLLIAVAPVWSIVPLAWGYVIYTLHTGSIWAFTWKGWCLFSLALCEVRPSDRCRQCIPYLIYSTLRFSSACITTTSPLSCPVPAQMAQAISVSSVPHCTVSCSLALLLYLTMATMKRP